MRYFDLWCAVKFLKLAGVFFLYILMIIYMEKLEYKQIKTGVIGKFCGLKRI